MSRHNILVLGYGEMGHAMEYLLQSRHDLGFWALELDSDLEQLAAGADIVLFCLPVNPHDEILARIQPLLKPDALCLSIAKGLDEQGRSAAQIFAGRLPDSAYALLYGPMISEEIRAGRLAFAQVGTPHAAIYNRVRALYQGSRLYLEHSNDIPGISWSVILKNVYAMAFGMADELHLGDNMRGYLAVAALHELDRIVEHMGGQPRSPFHLAGLGDLITTATSEDSHHHELGRRLARGETRNIAGEGVHTLQMVEKHRLFDTAGFPLFRLIGELVRDPQQLEQRLLGYVARVFG
jgi:glycerol-3-phosphate dehydrogenase (NAD(P)+)